jgi:hypothetical protein
MSEPRTLQRVEDPERQGLETMRYWQSRSVGERLTAVWDLSEAAYSFAASFRGVRTDDAERPQRSLIRIQRTAR